MIYCYVKGPFHHEGARVEQGARIELDPDAYARQRAFGNVVTIEEHQIAESGKAAAERARADVEAQARLAEEKAAAAVKASAESARAEAEAAPAEPRKRR